MKLSGRGLTCVRGGRGVFSGLDLDVAASQALAVTGPNGAGKSSLLRILAGLLHPESGAIVLEGGDPERSIGEHAHYLGHRDPFKPALTVRENLEFWQQFLGGEHADVGDSLSRAGIGHAAELPAVVLSAGQRRRLSMARLVAVKRPIWLLDEPISALDAAGQKLFASLMTRHLKNGGLIIAATHGPLGIEARELRIGGVA
ncbi:heme ABC exporter ATP-binding protein CcmA [Afipia sp. TerB]